MDEKQKKIIKAKFFLNLSSQYKEKIEIALPALIDSIKKENGIIESNFYFEKPVLGRNYYTSYIEAELTIEGYPNFFKLCVKLLPASVDIKEPMEGITLTYHEMKDIVEHLMVYTNAIRRIVVQPPPSKKENENDKKYENTKGT